MSADLKALKRSCWVYRLCLEEGARAAPALDYVRAWVREVNSPRHADALLVHGECAGEKSARRLVSTYRAMPAPKLVFLLGVDGGREELEKHDSGAKVFDLDAGLENGPEIVEAMLRIIAAQ
jgi:Ni,Fe-hydrogenase III small subunit